MTGTLRGSVVAGKRFCNCCHRSNAEMVKQKKYKCCRVGTCKPTEGIPNQGTRGSREQRLRSQLENLPGLLQSERRNSVARDGRTLRHHYHRGGGDGSQVRSRATPPGGSSSWTDREWRRREPPGMQSPGRKARHGRGTRSTRMGFEQEAYNEGCAAIAYALETAARRRKFGHLTISTDAHAAIWGVTSDDSDQGQQCAIAVRRHIAELRCKEPEISIEIRWCPSHCKIEGNEGADGRAMLATDEPDSNGVEWFNHEDRYGSSRMPPRSLAHLKHEFSEAKDRCLQEDQGSARQDQEQEVPAQRRAGDRPGCGSS